MRLWRAHGILGEQDARRYAAPLAPSGLQSVRSRPGLYPGSLRGCVEARALRTSSLGHICGIWQGVRHQLGSDLDERKVLRVEREQGAFRLTLQDGEEIRSAQVVIAT